MAGRHTGRRSSWVGQMKAALPRYSRQIDSPMGSVLEDVLINVQITPDTGRHRTVYNCLVPVLRIRARRNSSGGQENLSIALVDVRSV